MKKTLKSSLLILVMAVMLFAMTGCGGNKLVATRTTNGEDGLFGATGEVKEKIEVTFKNDKADKITWTMEFESEESATTTFALYQMAATQLDGMEVKQDKKKVVLKLDAKSFNEIAGESDDDSLTKENMKKMFEEEGYTVK